MSASTAPRALPASLFAAAILGILASAAALFQPPPPATLLTNARFVTPDGPLPAAALAIREGRIAALVAAEDLPAWREQAAEVVDLGGAVVIPGLRDAHGHLASLGALRLERERLDLSAAFSLEDMLNRLESALVTWPRGKWFVARGWDESTWEDPAAPLELSQLDTYAYDHPVFLSRVDGHAAWCNSKALALAGITAETPDPAGGQIVRDLYGDPTGLLIDNAMDLVRLHIPAATEAELTARLQRGLEAAAEVGLVEVHDAGLDRRHWRALERLAERGPLPLRVYGMVAASDRGFLEERLAAGPRRDPELSLSAVKIFADGALGSRGAALLEPYADADHAGLLTTPEAELEALVEACAKAGFQPCVHAIGDRANRLVLGVFEASGAPRPRIEHAQVIAPADIRRFAELGVIASMQPTHATTDQRWAEARLGAKRLEGAYAWRALLQADARLAFGSDFPVEPPAPLRGIYAAVTRKDPSSGEPAGGWRKDQAVSPAEALRLFTEGVAYAARAENQRGRLAVGQAADLTILSADPLEAARSAPEALLEIEVLGTWVAGRRVPGPRVAGPPAAEAEAAQGH